MLRTLLATFFCAPALAVPLAGNPAIEGIQIEVGPPNLLVVEAQEFLEASPIKPAVEKLVSRKRIDPTLLPLPEDIPAGSLTLAISDSKMELDTRFSAKASWTMSVPQVLDSQFVYYMQVLHFADQQPCDSYRTWGVAMTKFSGNKYASMVTAQASQPGQHRILGMLCAWSIKTEESFVLDAEELIFSVAAR